MTDVLSVFLDVASRWYLSPDNGQGIDFWLSMPPFSTRRMAQNSFLVTILNTPDSVLTAHIMNNVSVTIETLLL